MDNSSAKLGKYGEAKALEFLKTKNFIIHECNWRYKKDEIDIVAERKGWFVFVEVKTRSGTAYGKPWEAVDERKEKAMIRAAEAYISEKNLDVNIRFDIISIVVYEDENILIEHIENAISL